MLFANIDDGYLEGLLRGYRGGILTSADYANLCQCESIDGATRHRNSARATLLARGARHLLIGIRKYDLPRSQT